MARIRSPNYPAVSLREAIARAERIYKEEGQNDAPRDAMVRHMGFTSINGASLSVLSAVTKYGLLEVTGDKELRIGDLGLTILYPESHEEKREAIYRAANNPALFKEISERWPERSPSDENLKAYLARRGFAQRALEGVIKSYRDTMDLVNETFAEFEVVLTVPSEEERSEPASAVEAAPPRRSESFNPMQPGEFRVSIVGNRLEVTASLLDEEAVDQLIRILQANKPLLPRKNYHDAGNSNDKNEIEDHSRSSMDQGNELRLTGFVEDVGVAELL